MKLHVEVTEQDIKKLVVQELSRVTGLNIPGSAVRFEVMTKENYRATEWEEGRFRAQVNEKL